jgi:uncharacterized protein (DUF1778 family)
MARNPPSNAATTTTSERPARARTGPRNNRLNFRLTQEGSELIQRAAELEQRTMTDFCVSAALEVARETVARHEQLQLSARDRAAFFDALMNPPEPNEKLRGAFQAAKARIRSE